VAKALLSTIPPGMLTRRSQNCMTEKLTATTLSSGAKTASPVLDRDQDLEAEIEALEVQGEVAVAGEAVRAARGIGAEAVIEGLGAVHGIRRNLTGVTDRVHETDRDRATGKPENMSILLALHFIVTSAFILDLALGPAVAREIEGGIEIGIVTGTATVTGKNYAATYHAVFSFSG
jgi:hypothetical protein